MKRLDLSVGQRLAAGAIVVAVLIAVLSAVLFLSVARVSALRQEKLGVIAPRARLAQSLETAIYQQAVAFRNYALTGSPQDREEFRRALRNVEGRVELLEALPKAPAERALFGEIVAVAEEHQRGFDEMLALAAKGADRDAIREAEFHVSLHRNEILRRVQRFTALQVEKSENADAAINRAVDDLRLIVIVVAVLILGASLLSASIITRSVREPADRLVAAAEAMRSGTFAPALALAEPVLEGSNGETRERFRDELREASHVFGLMAGALKRREERLAAHATLSATLGASLDPREIAAKALREITAHLSAELGAVYLLDPGSNVLHAVATHALDVALPDVARGAGIPGQAAADRRTLVVRDIPPDTPFRIELGFAEARPRFLVASPMIVEDRVVGVVLLGALRELEGEGVRFVEEAACQLAITLDNALSHEHVARLVAELQTTNERLEEQNEELQVQSEELQAQSEELQTQNEELQSQAEELRAQQSALASTNRALAEAEEQKNRFLAVLGHELRNPLAAIRGAVVLADEGELSADGAPGVIEVMKRQTAHLARLVDDLLDVGRITSGKVQLTRRPLDLTALVARCVASAGRDDGAPISLKADDAVWIDADETRIEQIVTNLLTNALKFTPAEGTISVEVSQDPSGALVRVADTGIGMDPDLLPRIFDFFVQGEGRPENSKGGLGVGLTLVKNLVELHGGSVHATSAGRELGTTVTVRLPALLAPPILGASPQREPAPASSRKIVIVEDNADVRLMLLLMLRREGHTVSEAADGPAGVAAIARVQPDLAFIDLDLPGFDGCEVARRVRQDSRLARVRMIALSGYGRPEDRERALAAGFDDHLVKPVDFQRLTATIEETSPLAAGAADLSEGSPRLDILAPSSD